MGPVSFVLMASQNSLQFVTRFAASSPILLSSNAAANADLAMGAVGVDLSTGYRHGTTGMAALADTLTSQVADAVPVPEPQTWFMLPAGLAALAWLDHRRRPD